MYDVYVTCVMYVLLHTLYDGYYTLPYSKLYTQLRIQYCILLC